MITDDSSSGLGSAIPNPDSDDWFAYEITGANVSTTVVYALADVAGTDPCELGFALSEYVDPGALDRLFAEREDAAVFLSVAGHDVCVVGERTVMVRA